MNRFKLIVLSATNSPLLSRRRNFSAICSTASLVRHGPVVSVSLRDL
jgi:hypothetical protein